MSIICNFLKHCYLIHFIWNQAVSVFVVAEEVKWVNAHRSSRRVLHASPPSPLLLISVDSQLYCGIRVCSGYGFAPLPPQSARVFCLPRHTQAIRKSSHSEVEWDPRVFTPSLELSTQTLFCAQSFILDLTAGSKWHIVPCRTLAFLVHRTLGGFKRGNIWIPCRNPLVY